MYLTKNPLGLALNLLAEGLDKGSVVDFVFFEKVNKEENPFLFVTTPAMNIP